MTIAGGLFIFFSALSTWFSFVMTATASLSIMSRMVCCWGRMRRPLGAALSMGVTSNTWSSGLSKSAQMGKGAFFWGTRWAKSSFSSLIFLPVVELTEICGMEEGMALNIASGAALPCIVFCFASLAAFSCVSFGKICFAAVVSETLAAFCSSTSAFVNTTTQDSSLSWMRCSIFKSSSVMPAVLSMTRMAMSVLFNTCKDFCTRSCPSSPLSSMPAVSIISTGPKGNSSMAFNTGSVVVPGTSATTASFCPVRALIRLDLPALRFPNKPIWTRSPAGVAFKLLMISPFLSGYISEKYKDCTYLIQKAYCNISQDIV